MADHGPYDDEREVREAIEAGERARRCLEDARGSLRSASRWGLVDIFGGGFLSTLAKHDRLDSARSALLEAARALGAFADEVRDVRGLRVPEVRVDEWLTFADFFFDGALADIMVQRRIDDALDEVDRTLAQVDTVLRELRGLL